MKIYKEDKNWVIDGEGDFTICRKREYFIKTSKDVKHFIITNHHMYMLGTVNKLKILWDVAKYIFKKEASHDYPEGDE